MRTERYQARVGNLSASFSTVWSTNLLAIELTNFPPRQTGKLDLEYYGRKYPGTTTRSRTGVFPRHPTWTTLQLVASVDEVPLPVVLSVAVSTNAFLKGGVIPLDGKQAIGYLVLGNPPMKNWRVLSLLMDGKGSITLDRSGLKLGDEVSGHIEAEVTAFIRWEDFDLRVFKQTKANRKQDDTTR